MTDQRSLSLLLVLPLVAPQDGLVDEAYDSLQSVERVTPVVRVVQAVTPSIVFIETEYTKRVSNFFGDWYKTDSGGGTGVVVHPSGYVVTNYHVVRNAQKIRTSFASDPELYSAELVSYVPSEDLALLKIAGEGPFPTVRMGTSSDLWPGEDVVAIGNPYGQTHTVSTGIISGLHRGVSIPEMNLEFQDLIQTDASINFGNSGGPLLNIQGRMIGINTAMNVKAENIGFAIPVDRVREVLTDILYPQARKSWLGFKLEPEEDELRVARVYPGSPAAAAGICEGDRILSLGDNPVANQEDFLHASLQLEPHRPVNVGFERGVERGMADLATWDRIDGMLFERLGMTVSERAIGRRNWILVNEVCDGGPADRLGLRRGDLIPALKPDVGRWPQTFNVDSKRTLARIVGSLEPGVRIDLNIVRDEDGDRRFTRSELYEGTIWVQ